jgi:hypothetical protein
VARSQNKLFEAPSTLFIGCIKLQYTINRQKWKNDIHGMQSTKYISDTLIKKKDYQAIYLVLKEANYE